MAHVRPAPKPKPTPWKSKSSPTSGRAPVRHAVAIDEPRATVSEHPRELSIRTAQGVDPLAEELGESWVQNVTGADDASSERRGDDALDADDSGVGLSSPT